MATNIETMWVGDPEQLQRTVQNLVTRGGVVQGQSDTEVSLSIKKKINVPVLVVGLILCLVPGLAYLIWYLTADQNQQVTVKVGTPDTIKTDHQHWYDSDGTERPAGSAADATVPAPPAGLGTADPASIPPLPTAAPEAAPAVPPPPPAPPAPPAGGTSF
jgi:hypothetical protein